MDSKPHFENLPEPTMVDDILRKQPLTRARRIISFERLEELMQRFSPSERLLLYIFSIALGLSVIVLLIGLNSALSEEIPTRGGTLTEGETGPARFINPVLAVSEPDQDLSQLIYSGLMRALPDGSYTPDLAENYNISSDGTQYTFTLRKNATFHDGTPVTASDVLYTIATAQNPDIKSPHRADWEGVVTSSPDPYTVVFTLPHAYAPFIENATLGIVPKHLWQSVQPDSFPFSQLNTHPIGSGPYKVGNVRTDATGAPTRYDLVPFDDFTLGGNYLAHISFVFFPNQESLIKAFNAHQIDAVGGVSPSEITSFKRDDVSALVVPLPRVFGIFFNQNHNAVLADAYVRQALEESIDKQAVVDSALHGYGEVIDSPIPPGILSSVRSSTTKPVNPSDATTTSSSTVTVSDTPIATLKRGGWSISSSTQLWTKKPAKAGSAAETLSLKLATADEPELVATANLIAAQWHALGVDVDVQIYPLSDFNNTVLRPRNYDAILFGEVVSRSGDLFAFWHSSQRNDPGLNLALYANSKADTLLSKARASSSREERDSLNEQFVSIVQSDRPAIFLYSPDFIYIVPSKIHDIQIGALSGAWERYLNAYQWYSETEDVWNFFAKNN